MVGADNGNFILTLNKCLSILQLVGEPSNIKSEMPHKTLFQLKHEIKYGLKVAEMDPVTSQLVSMSCQFCVLFGREMKVGEEEEGNSSC